MPIINIPQTPTTFPYTIPLVHNAEQLQNGGGTAKTTPYTKRLSANRKSWGSMQQVGVIPQQAIQITPHLS